MGEVTPPPVIFNEDLLLLLLLLLYWPQKSIFWETARLLAAFDSMNHRSLWCLLLHIVYCVASARHGLPSLGVNSLRLLQLRGGATAESSRSSRKLLHVSVSSSLGTRWLDRHCTLHVKPETTVKELKDSVATSFPGKPPATIQRLFFGTKLLKDEDRVDDVAPPNAPDRKSVV